MNIRNFSKGKVLLSWVISYTLILIIPIFIGVVVYVQSTMIISEEINKAHNTSLQQLKSIIDNKFDELSKMSNMISLDKNLQSLMNMDKNSQVKNILTIMAAQNDITKFKISNSFIEDMYIYINNSNIMFSDTYKYDEDEIKIVCKNLGFHDDEFVKLSSTNQIKNILIREIKTGDDNRNKKIVFIQSLFSSGYKNPKGIFVAVIDEYKLKQLLRNLEWTTQGNVILVNDKNEFIENEASSVLPYFLKDYALNNEFPNSNFVNTKKDYIVTKLKSDLVKMQYVSIISTSIFFKKVQLIKNIFIIYNIVCLIVGLSLVSFFIKKNYSPIINLIQMFIGRHGKIIPCDINEFKFLENSLRSLFSENDTFLTRLKQQDGVLRNNLFIKLLKRRVYSLNYIKDSLTRYGITFKSDYYMVVMISIKEINGETFSNSFSESEDPFSLIYFAVKKMIEESINEKHIGYMAEVDGMMACLINVIPKGDALSIRTGQILKDTCEVIKKDIEFLEEELGVFFTVAMSDIHYGVEGISKAYSESLEVFEYKKLTDDPDKIVSYNSIFSQENNSLYDTNNLESERLFINCIRVADYKKAKEILDKMIADNFRKEVKSLQLVKCRMFGLINSMINAMGEISSLDTDFFNTIDPVGRLLNTESVVELKNQVDDIFNRLTEYLSNKDKENVPDWIERVDNYVTSVYYNPNLSVANISARLNMSISYLSRTYKRAKGIGLLDFIHKVRLEKAKQLLNEDMNLKDVAEKTGYLESKALIRSFKRYEGITPGRFRELTRQNS